jgi:hypothetical protein
MKYKELRKKWDEYTEGWFGNVIYLVLGFIIAYSLNLFLGYALNTQTPVVAVFSCSMEHNDYNSWFCKIKENEVCGKDMSGYDPTNFDDYWKLCGSWYETQNISKNKFESFPFTDGLEVGDMIIVLNTNDFKVGDIIIFDTDFRKYPIIHRIYADGSKILTKGDNNSGPDSFEKTKIHGKAILKIPLLGWVKILFTEVTGIA